MNKPIIILIALFLLLNYQSTFAQTTHSPRLADHAELLSASEQQELTQLLDAVSEKYEQDVVIITTYSLDGKTATEYAEMIITIITIMDFLVHTMEFCY